MQSVSKKNRQKSVAGPMSASALGRPRSEAVTQQLHAALWKLLEEEEFDALTMERVAETAGVTRPSLYRRYANLGELTLGALLSFGEAKLPMATTQDVSRDLRTYFAAVVRSLQPGTPVGRAMRGVLAHALTHPPFTQPFAAFLEARRRPVLVRLQAAKPQANSGEIDMLLDGLFGPVLYRLLIRQQPVSAARIAAIVKLAVEAAGL